MNNSRVTMNCDLFEQILADVGRSDVLPGALRESALAHAEVCPKCGRLLTESESLDMHLRSLAMAARTQEASPRLESALLQEFRAFHEDQRRGRRRWQLAALGVAAATVLAAGYFLSGHFLPGQNSGNDAGGTAMGTAAPANTATSTISGENAAGTSGRNGSERHAPVRNPVVEGKITSEQEAAFIPLPYADSTGEIEGGEVIRVILSPVALESMGLGSSDLNSSGDVSADLLLDEAGTPEAIRLVAQSDQGSVSN